MVAGKIGHFITASLLDIYKRNSSSKSVPLMTEFVFAGGMGDVMSLLLYQFERVYNTSAKMTVIGSCIGTIHSLVTMPQLCVMLCQINDSAVTCVIATIQLFTVLHFQSRSHGFSGLALAC